MNYGKAIGHSSAEAYTVQIRYRFPGLMADDYLPIRPGDTVGGQVDGGFS